MPISYGAADAEAAVRQAKPGKRIGAILALGVTVVGSVCFAMSGLLPDHSAQLDVTMHSAHGGDDHVKSYYKQRHSVSIQPGHEEHFKGRVLPAHSWVVAPMGSPDFWGDSSGMTTLGNQVSGKEAEVPLAKRSHARPGTGKHAKKGEAAGDGPPSDYVGSLISHFVGDTAGKQSHNSGDSKLVVGSDEWMAAHPGWVDHRTETEAGAHKEAVGGAADGSATPIASLQDKVDAKLAEYTKVKGHPEAAQLGLELQQLKDSLHAAAMATHGIKKGSADHEQEEVKQEVKHAVTHESEDSAPVGSDKIVVGSKEWMEAHPRWVDHRTESHEEPAHGGGAHDDSTPLLSDPAPGSDEWIKANVDFSKSDIPAPDSLEAKIAAKLAGLESKMSADGVGETAAAPDRVAASPLEHLMEEGEEETGLDGEEPVGDLEDVATADGYESGKQEPAAAPWCPRVMNLFYDETCGGPGQAAWVLSPTAPSAAAGCQNWASLSIGIESGSDSPPDASEWLGSDSMCSTGGNTTSFTVSITPTQTGTAASESFPAGCATNPWLKVQGVCDVDSASSSANGIYTCRGLTEAGHLSYERDTGVGHDCTDRYPLEEGRRCFSSCTQVPSTCEDFMAMTKPGGCAGTCVDAFDQAEWTELVNMYCNEAPTTCDAFPADLCEACSYCVDFVHCVFEPNLPECATAPNHCESTCTPWVHCGENDQSTVIHDICQDALDPANTTPAPTANGTASCGEGTFMATWGECSPCSVCPMGQEESSPCAPTMDRICAPTPGSGELCDPITHPDSYMLEGSCSSCTVCVTGEMETGPCGPDMDRVCEQDMRTMDPTIDPTVSYFPPYAVGGEPGSEPGSEPGDGDDSDGPPPCAANCTSEPADCPAYHEMATGDGCSASCGDAVKEAFAARMGCSWEDGVTADSFEPAMEPEVPAEPAMEPEAPLAADGYGSGHGYGPSEMEPMESESPADGRGFGPAMEPETSSDFHGCHATCTSTPTNCMEFQDMSGPSGCAADCPGALGQDQWDAVEALYCPHAHLPRCHDFPSQLCSICEPCVDFTHCLFQPGGPECANAPSHCAPTCGNWIHCVQTDQAAVMDEICSAAGEVNMTDTGAPTTTTTVRPDSSFTQSCHSTCTELPTNCGEFTDITSAGGCADGCSTAFPADEWDTISAMFCPRGDQPGCHDFPAQLCELCMPCVDFARCLFESNRPECANAPDHCEARCGQWAHCGMNGQAAVLSHLCGAGPAMEPEAPTAADGYGSGPAMEPMGSEPCTHPPTSCDDFDFMTGPDGCAHDSPTALGETQWAEVTQMFCGEQSVCWEFPADMCEVCGECVDFVHCIFQPSRPECANAPDHCSEDCTTWVHCVTNPDVVGVIHAICDSTHGDSDGSSPADGSQAPYYPPYDGGGGGVEESVDMHSASLSSTAKAGFWAARGVIKPDADRSADALAEMTGTEGLEEDLTDAEKRLTPLEHMRLAAEKHLRAKHIDPEASRLYQEAKARLLGKPVPHTSHARVEVTPKRPSMLISQESSERRSAAADEADAQGEDAHSDVAHSEAEHSEDEQNDSAQATAQATKPVEEVAITHPTAAGTGVVAAHIKAAEAAIAEAEAAGRTVRANSLRKGLMNLKKTAQQLQASVDPEAVVVDSEASVDPIPVDVVPVTQSRPDAVSAPIYIDDNPFRRRAPRPMAAMISVPADESTAPEAVAEEGTAVNASEETVAEPADAPPADEETPPPADPFASADPFADDSPPADEEQGAVTPEEATVERPADEEAPAEAASADEMAATPDAEAAAPVDDGAAAASEETAASDEPAVVPEEHSSAPEETAAKMEEMVVKKEEIVEEVAVSPEEIAAGEEEAADKAVEEALGEPADEASETATPTRAHEVSVVAPTETVAPTKTAATAAVQVAATDAAAPAAAVPGVSTGAPVTVDAHRLAAEEHLRQHRLDVAANLARHKAMPPMSTTVAPATASGELMTETGKRVPVLSAAEEHLKQHRAEVAENLARHKAGQPALAKSAKSSAELTLTMEEKAIIEKMRISRRKNRAPALPTEVGR